MKEKEEKEEEEGVLVVVEVTVCVGERVEDALNSVLLTATQSLPADVMQSALEVVCEYFSGRCDGQPPRDIIAFNLFDNDFFIVREGYDESQLLHCYCSRYPCLDDLGVLYELDNEPISSGPHTSAANATEHKVTGEEGEGTGTSEERDPFFDIYSGTVPEDKLQQYFTLTPHFANAPLAVRRHDGRIFVSVASYRDPQLPFTISSLISMCSDPKLLTVVICEQRSPSDPVTDWSLFPTQGAILINISMDSSLARGPTWARFLIQRRWTGEEFYLQIDSHMRFVENWDIKLKADLKKIPPEAFEKACLTNYPPGFDVLTGEVDSVLRGPMYVTHIDSKDRFIRFDSDYLEGVQVLPSPVLSKGWSGCFSFSSSQIIFDAPYDPYLPFLFFGEEMDIFARLFTRGWQMYIPSRPICYTAFDRSYRKTFWGHPDNELVRFSRMRLHNKFGLLSIQAELRQGINEYYLGQNKTMIDFFNFVGLSSDIYFGLKYNNITPSL